MFYYRFVHIMQFIKLNMKDNWEPSVGEVKLWEYRYVFVLCPFYVGYTAHSLLGLYTDMIWNKMRSSQWDNDNQHFVYIIVSWYLLGIITSQGFLFSCSCMNRCTCMPLIIRYLAYCLIVLEYIRISTKYIHSQNVMHSQYGYPQFLVISYCNGAD